jgi:peptidase YpeB-like protein
MKLSKAQSITVAIAAMVASFASSALAVDDLTDLLTVDAKNFSRPTIIDNKYMPLKPGSKHVFEGYTIEDDGEKVPHKVIQIITDLTKVVNGIETVIGWEVDIEDGKLAESELWFRAQDDEGNVWHFGEVKEVYDDNIKLAGAKVWLDGFLGCKSGIIMPGKPAEGKPSISQGYAPGVYVWDDRGQVRKMGETVTLPLGTFKDVMVVEEWSAPERLKEAIQLKYYAPGVGYIQVGFEGNDPVKEVLNLVEHSQLAGKEMDAARAEALLVEERSFFYGRDTKRAKRSERVLGKLTEEQAKEIALKAVKGKVTDAKVETKFGKETFVVEVVTPDDEEVDVVIDLETGKVLATEK